jgi:hypothetical protein
LASKHLDIPLVLFLYYFTKPFMAKTKETTTETTLPSRQWQASDLADFSKVQEMGKQLNQVINEYKLASKISNKDYVQVEGWQFAGTMLGLSARTAGVTDKSYWDAANNKWVYEFEAKVEIINAITGQIVGCGFALCTNAEANKKSYDKYAIASMAQTRAVSKGYRNILAWVVKLAGFEVTPYEEMEAVTGSQPQHTPPQPLATKQVCDEIDYYFSVPFIPLAETTPLKARYDHARNANTLTQADAQQLAAILNALFYKYQPKQDPTIDAGKEKVTLTQPVAGEKPNDLPF